LRAGASEGCIADDLVDVVCHAVFEHQPEKTR
jgi:hypothetical protein